VSVQMAFSKAGDIGRTQALSQIARVLDKGVKVALVYGDRDFACNWLLGETISLLVNYTGSDDFASAGYSPIFSGSNTAIGGFVRQNGNFSFSRVFQAGHEGMGIPHRICHRRTTNFDKVPSYQPEVSYDLFTRALFNKDMSTGLLPLLDSYKSIGPDSTWHIKNEIPERPEPLCFILSPATCTTEQYETVLDGTAIIKDWVVIGVNSGEKVSGFQSNGNTQDYLGREDL